MFLFLMVSTKGSGSMVVFFMVAATSNSAHFRLIHLPSSLSILDVHLCPFTRFFYLSRGRVIFLSWERIFLSSLTRQRYKIKRCKTSIFRIYFKFILNVKIWSSEYKQGAITHNTITFVFCISSPYHI